MTWPDALELCIDGMAQGGEAVGRLDGRVIFAAGGLPGERVRLRLTERRDAYARGVVTEVLTPSPERVPPRLPGADHMPWQHIAYGAQLRFKRQILAEQLAKIGGLEAVEVEPTIPAAREWQYRTGAHLHIAGGQIGYHAAGTRAIQPLDADPLLAPALNDALAALRTALPGSGAAPTDAILRQSEAFGYVVAALRGRGDLRSLARRWRAADPRIAGVALPDGALGDDHLIEELDGLAFRLAPTTFFQVNVAMAETLLRLVRAGLGHPEAGKPRTRLASPATGGRLLDGYCGAGTFTLPLARAAAEVIGIEEHPGAAADGQASAALNGITNARFVIGTVERALAELDGPFDAAVLDPPRRGCHPRALEELLRLAPLRIVYVSCHPATLARDLRILTVGGYRVLRVTPVDLFPQTPHIESVAVLEKV
jgi:23S rRNA (uracil1939-C5)-methyltransferase